MKISVYRQSGQPVKPEAQDLYKQEWQVFYDKATERAKLDMFKLQRFLRYGETMLLRKHEAVIEVELPKTSKAWTDLINKYTAPILIARKADEKGLVLILLDQNI